MSIQDEARVVGYKDGYNRRTKQRFMTESNNVAYSTGYAEGGRARRAHETLRRSPGAAARPLHHEDQI